MKRYIHVSLVNLTIDWAVIKNEIFPSRLKCDGKLDRGRDEKTWAVIIYFAGSFMGFLALYVAYDIYKAPKEIPSGTIIILIYLSIVVFMGITGILPEMIYREGHLVTHPAVIPFTGRIGQKCGGRKYGFPIEVVKTSRIPLAMVWLLFDSLYLRDERDEKDLWD